jgi:hypothetical protein
MNKLVCLYLDYSRVVSGRTVVEYSTYYPKTEGSNPATDTSGLYYKSLTIVNDDGSVISK